MSLHQIWSMKWKRKCCENPIGVFVRFNPSHNEKRWISRLQFSAQTQTWTSMKTKNVNCCLSWRQQYFFKQYCLKLFYKKKKSAPEVFKVSNVSVLVLQFSHENLPSVWLRMTDWLQISQREQTWFEWMCYEWNVMIILFFLACLNPLN